MTEEELVAKSKAIRKFVYDSPDKDDPETRNLYCQLLWLYRRESKSQRNGEVKRVVDSLSGGDDWDGFYTLHGYAKYIAYFHELNMRLTDWSKQ